MVFDALTRLRKKYEDFEDRAHEKRVQRLEERSKREVKKAGQRVKEYGYNQVIKEARSVVPKPGSSGFLSGALVAVRQGSRNVAYDAFAGTAYDLRPRAVKRRRRR